MSKSKDGGALSFCKMMLFILLLPAVFAQAQNDTEVKVEAITIRRGLQASTVHIYPGDSFGQAVSNIQPGTTLIVHQGDYYDTMRISITVDATASAPVVIQNDPTESSKPRILRAASAARQNMINIEGASYVTIKGLEIADFTTDAIRFGGDDSQFITLEDLHLHDVSVGVNAQANVDHLTVRRCQIHDIGRPGDTGEGMYLGRHVGDRIVTNSIIEQNLVYRTNGDQGDGIELKTNSYNNIIRDNVIFDTKYPCILLYGSGSGSRNIVERNVMWNCASGGMQIAADALVRNNIVLNSGYGLLSQPHNGVTPKNLEIVHNSFIDHSIKCLNIREWQGRTDIIFSANVIYCESDTLDMLGVTSGVQMTMNAVYPSANQFPPGSYFVGRGIGQDFVDVAGLNAYPTSDSPVINQASGFNSNGEDFDGAIAFRNDVGAYEWSSSGRKWIVASDFKGGAGSDQPGGSEDPDDSENPNEDETFTLLTLLVQFLSCGLV